MPFPRQRNSLTSRIASSLGRFEVVPGHLIRLVSKHFRTLLLDCLGHPVLDRLLKRIYECVWVCVCVSMWRQRNLEIPYRTSVCCIKWACGTFSWHTWHRPQSVCVCVCSLSGAIASGRNNRGGVACKSPLALQATD